MILKILFLCLACFIAAFIDSIAGGGGLITLPAFLIAGVPVHYTLGTSKFSSTASSLTSSIKYIRSGNTNFTILKYLIPSAFIGAIFGVCTVLKIAESILQTLVLILVIFIGIYSSFSKSIGFENKFVGTNKKNITVGSIFAFILGFYDGFFGPGVGAFLIFGLIRIYGFNFIKAGGNARVLNFTTNIASLIVFIIGGKVNFLYGVPIAIAMMFGARFGTKFALIHGSKLIKPIFITMALAVTCKMLFNLVF